MSEPDEDQNPEVVQQRLVLPVSEWKKGDIVTRDGTDEQVIEDIPDTPDPYDNFTVRCIKRPADGWIEVGEDETNLIVRYGFVRRENAQGLPPAANNQTGLDT